MSDEERPTALLVGTYKETSERHVAEEHLEELSRLADTYGADTAAMVACPLRKINRATFLGEGKIAELAIQAEELGVDMVIFDMELAPSQQRNIEKAFGRNVLERREVILEVFVQHAKTKEARLQIELAKIRYQLPRLKRLWTHLSRQRGGGVASKGEGEKQIELDKRMLQHRTDKLVADLKEVRQQRQTQRQARKRSAIPTFAIVGYTNAGKSTLLNALTDAEVLVEDQLFATLDTTTRKFLLPNKQEILLIDTVGFIRKLPHQLVAAFKSTLEEAAYADIILHVIDASSPVAYEQAEATLEVLEELGVHDKPTITLLNKIDACEGADSFARLRMTYTRTIPISGITGEGFESLQEAMMEELAALRKPMHLRIPQSEYALVSELMGKGEILEQDYEGNDVVLEVLVPNEMVGRVEKYQS